MTLLAHASSRMTAWRRRTGDHAQLTLRPCSNPSTRSSRAEQPADQRGAAGHAQGILEFICGRRHPVPALSSVALRNCQGYGGIGGPGWWVAGAARRPSTGTAQLR
ncbi:hypothetical protein ACPA9J_36060 [Pseudomonas aeruginosa]